MRFPYRLLMDAEEVVVHRHPHVRVLFRPVAVTVVVFGLAAVLALATRALAASLAAAVLVVVAVGARPLLHWLTTTLTVTDRRLLLRSGVLARYGRDVPLSRIVEVSFEHSLFERMFGSGTLYVELANGRGMVVVQNVPNVEDVHGAIYQLLEDVDLEDVDLEEVDEDSFDDEELAEDAEFDEPEDEEWDAPVRGRRWLRRRQAGV